MGSLLYVCARSAARPTRSTRPSAGHSVPTSSIDSTCSTDRSIRPACAATAASSSAARRSTSVTSRRSRSSCGSRPTCADRSARDRRRGRRVLHVLQHRCGDTDARRRRDHRDAGGRERHRDPHDTGGHPTRSSAPARPRSRCSRRTRRARRRCRPVPSCSRRTRTARCRPTASARTCTRPSSTRSPRRATSPIG